MLDWFSGFVGYDASQMPLGRNLRLDTGGHILYETPTWETARGSHDATIQVSSTVPTAAMLQAARDYGYHCSQGPVLRLSGNPIKYLQGHNVFGPSVSHLGPVLQDLARSLPGDLRPIDADVQALPVVHRSRVDTNVTVDLGSHELVHRWIENAARSTRSHHGRATGSGSTVYWGLKSKRWTLKAYCKHCELKKHQPNVSPSDLKNLMEYSEGKLRIELTLKRLELKDRDTLSEDIIWEFYDRITIGVMKNDVEKVSQVNMKPSEKRTLQLWTAGFEPKQTMSKNTYYRHRRAILDETGIDIGNPRPYDDKVIDRKLFDRSFLQPRAVGRPPESLRKLLHKVA